MNECAIDIQDYHGKWFKLSFLTYIETKDGVDCDVVVGYSPFWRRRGAGYGRHEEFYATEEEARKRMEFLIGCNAIEDCKIQRWTGVGWMMTLIEEWSDPSVASE